MLSDDVGPMADAQSLKGDERTAELVPVWSSLPAPQFLALMPRRVVEPVVWVGHAPFVMWLVEQWEPSQVVVLGVGAGNAFFAVCEAVLRAGFASAIVGVDEWQDLHGATHSGAGYESVSAHCSSTYGSFASLMRCAFDEALPRFADGAIDVLHIDGCRDYDSVRHDYQSWLPKLSVQGVVLIHGIQNREEGVAGASRLWAEIRRYYPHCEFAHSGGLGVLFVGRAMEPRRASLRDVLGTPSAAEPLHGLFSSFGGLLASERQASLRIDAAAANLKRLTREIESRGSALARLQAIVESVRAERDQVKGRARRADELDAALAQSRAEHVSLERRLDESNAELLARENHRVELRGEIERLEAELSRVREVVREVAELRHQVEQSEAVRARITTLEAAVDARDAEIGLLRSSLAGAADAHRQAIGEAESVASELRDQLERIVQHAADVQIMLEQSDQELESVRSELALREQSLDGARTDLLRTEQALEVARAEVLRRDRQLTALLKVEQDLRLQRRVAQALRSALDERWRERSELFTCRTWRLWQPVREVLTRITRRRKNMSIKLAVADALAALLGRPPLNPPPLRDPLLDVRQEHAGTLS